MAGWNKIRAYGAGLLRGLSGLRPRRVLSLLGGSDFAVKRLDAQGFSILVDVRDYALAKPILVAGRYEPHVTAALLSEAREDTVFLDVGANIGFFTLLLASRCPSGRAFSIEPDPDNARLLAASVALNGFSSRVTVHPVAASDEEGVLTLSDLGNARNLGARFTAKRRDRLDVHVHGPAPKFVEVRATRLDGLIDVPRLDLVKMDIEGFEPVALRGMEGLLRKHRPVLVMEFAPGTIRDIAGEEPVGVLKALIASGYELGVVESEGRARTMTRDADALLKTCESLGVHHVDLLARPRA